MSLNISASGFSYNSKLNALTANDTLGTAHPMPLDGTLFDAGLAAKDSEEFRHAIDTAGFDLNLSAAGVLPAPSAMGVCGGAIITFVKANAGGGVISYTDPVMGITYAYVNKQGESITLVADLDGGNDQWLVRV